MLDIRHLQLLTALRATGSLAAAADELCVTASAVSHQLKELEKHYGLSLVNRKSRPLSFSPAGLEVLRLADEVLPSIAKTHTTIKRLAKGHTGRLRLASECHSCFDWLMPILNRYRSAYADVELDFATAFEPDPHQSLGDGETDLLITASVINQGNLHYVPIFTYESRLVLAPTHPLAQKTAIAPQDLSDQTLICYPVDEERLDVVAHFLTPHGIRPNSFRTTTLTAMLIQLVASERGVAALPDWVLAEYEKKGWVVSRPLGTGVFCTLFAAVRTDSLHLDFIQGFLGLLSQVKKPDFVKHKITSH